jgi:dienelactone hydrolase
MITTHEVSVRTRHGSMTCHVWDPAQEGTRPGILLLMEAYGVTDHIKDVGSRLAAEGYTVLAPDLYYRDFPANTTFAYADRPKAMDAMDALDINLAAEDATAALQALTARPGVRGIGAMGLCFGAALLLPLSAAAGSSLSAGAAFYGHCDGAWLEAVPRIVAPTIFFYGDRDAVITPVHVDALEAKLLAANKTYKIKRYPTAGHAYFNPRRAEYNQEASTASWVELKAFLSKYLPARGQQTAQVEAAAP